MPNKDHVLVFDVGGTKTAWATVGKDGTIAQHGITPTVKEPGAFLKNLELVADKHSHIAIGIGIAGTVSTESGGVLICTNIPSLSHYELKEHLLKKYSCPIVIDNDARVALVGEAWKGAARETSSAVMITLGTGVGGAVMQREKILPHPTDVSRELGRIMADPTDLFPAITGTGSIEGLLGGRNLEERFGVPLHDLAAAGHKGEEEAVEIWKIIAYYFLQSIQAICYTYNPKMIIVGGKGVQDLDLFIQEEMPTKIIPATLGEQAGLIGAARLAWDAIEEQEAEKERGWDE